MATGSQDSTSMGGATGAPVPAPPMGGGGSGVPFWQQSMGGEYAQGYGFHSTGRGFTSTNPAASDPAYSQLGLDPNASASDIYAALTRQQWQQYLTTFVPIENQLIAYATDTSQPGKAMAAAGADVNNAYTAQQGSLAREQRGLGVTLTPEQQAAQTREFGVSKSLANVQAQNTARDLTISNQQSILGNPAPTTESIAQQAAQLGS